MTKQERIELLKAMHIVMMNANDERCYYHWITVGVPDEPSDGDFEYIATNKEEFKEVINIFCNLVHDFF